ncbi:MAG: type II toxin-antitoxin system MqsA family antitoxin [Elusimicrobia bacterium]|nr:type II toxin-antitoxin system MqsA family antitoxin [Elusimicrobiota bacterium]
MKKNRHTCYFCRGILQEKKVDIDYRWKGNLCILEAVPAEVCSQCGEKFFTAEVSRQMDELVQSKGFAKTLQIPVKSF